MSDELLSIARTAFNEAWRNIPTGTDPQDARDIGRRAEINAVRDAVIEECAKHLEESGMLPRWKDAADRIRALKGGAK